MDISDNKQAGEEERPPTLLSLHRKTDAAARKQELKAEVNQAICSASRIFLCCYYSYIFLLSLETRDPWSQYSKLSSNVSN